MRVLSIVSRARASTGGGGLFEELVDAARRPARALGHAGRRRTGAGRARSATTRSWCSAARCIPTRTRSIPWLADEAAFLREALDREVPLLGVCLGAQLIARAAGASVGPAGSAEVGWHERRAQRRRAGRSGPRRAAGPVRRLPVALLRLRAARRAPSSSPRTTPPARPTGSASARGACSSIPR